LVSAEAASFTPKHVFCQMWISFGEIFQKSSADVAHFKKECDICLGLFVMVSKDRWNPQIPAVLFFFRTNFTGPTLAQILSPKIFEKKLQRMKHLLLLGV
jgi:hypothetical protein